MKKTGFPSNLRIWLNNIPIDDSVDRLMASLLQVMLIGIVFIIVLATVGNLFLPDVTTQSLAILIRGLVASLIFGFPLFLLRRGFLHGSVYFIIILLLLLVTFAVFNASLRSIAENLTFFTLAIVLAGLLVNRKTLLITFAFSAGMVLIGAFRPQDVTLQEDNIAVALNFILLNGVMTLFLDRFGLTLRQALTDSKNREHELSNEIETRRQVEAALQKNYAQLEINNAELERFTYTVSHDLRSPLVTIKGFLGMLKQDLQEDRQDKIQSDFQRIAGAADKMDGLLSELLELSRTGRIINELEEIDLANLIHDALDSVGARIQSKHVTVQVAQNFSSIYGDRIRLREVFENLIDNAVKNMGDQPNPTIEIGMRNEMKEPVIFVKDNGIGIEEKYLTKIFGLFEKLNPTIDGTGIGLALVKRIIETHGGNIWAESEGPGKGSMFCFTIPNIGS